MKKVITAVGRARVAFVSGTVSSIFFAIAFIVYFYDFQISSLFVCIGLFLLSISAISTGLRTHQNSLVVLTNKSLLRKRIQNENVFYSAITSKFNSSNEYNYKYLQNCTNEIIRVEKTISRNLDVILKEVQDIQRGRKMSELGLDTYSEHIKRDSYKLDQIPIQPGSKAESNDSLDEAEPASFSGDIELILHRIFTLNQNLESSVEITGKQVQELNKRLEFTKDDLKKYVEALIKDAQFSQLTLIQQLISSIDAKETIGVPPAEENVFKK